MGTNSEWCGVARIFSGVELVGDQVLRILVRANTHNRTRVLFLIRLRSLKLTPHSKIMRNMILISHTFLIRVYAGLEWSEAARRDDPSVLFCKSV
jgi:hypothetical protein